MEKRERMARYSRGARRRGSKQKSQVNFTLIVGIILIAVLAGYLTTRFIIYPFLLQEEPQIGQGNGQQNEQPDSVQPPVSDGVVTDGLDVNDVTDKDKISNAEPNTAPAIASSGYCIQFGSFTTQAAADNLVSQLSLSGIGTKVVEKDGNFKVVGELFPDKTQAISAMQELDQTLFEGVFITTI